MRTNVDFDAFLEEAKQSDTYWVEKAKLDFAIKLEKQRRSVAMTYSAIAKKIATSGAYITKVFRGDTNVTIETMVKLARATGGEIEINIVDVGKRAAQWDAGALRSHKAGSIRTTSATVIAFPVAANHDEFQQKYAAAA